MYLIVYKRGMLKFIGGCIHHFGKIKGSLDTPPKPIYTPLDKIYTPFTPFHTAKEIVKKKSQTLKLNPNF